MRVLILLRGAPGCGKTTWIEKHNLKPFSLSADELRTMIQSPMLDIDGEFCISQNNDKKVWETLFSLLEARMKRGELTVIDATNSKTADMNRYRTIAEEYRYRVYLVDFTDIPIDVCKAQNKSRPQYKQVPDDVIDLMYARFATQSVPGRIKVIHPDQLNTIWYRPADFSKYRRIHHIGDVHGCYTALMKYMEGNYHEDELYIFTGDYIDRGLESAQVVKYLSTLCELPNVLLLEGNHERWINEYGHNRQAASKEFENHTKQELIDSGFTPKDARMLYRHFGQCAYYTYGEKTVLVTHGGLSTIPDCLTEIAFEEMMKGTGRYQDYLSVAASFDKSTPNNYYQVFGHRNTESSPIQVSERCFDLEGAVEFGGCLRVVTLDNDGFHPIEIQNTVYRKIEIKKVSQVPANVSSLVESMRANKYVQERKFGHISSFNFTKDAFYDGIWDEQTMRARGLFINTEDNTIVARAYEKFFNINEQSATKLPVLQHTMTFPISAYVKENGFLALVSYDKKTDDLFITSKSIPTGPYAQWAKDIFYSTVRSADDIKEFLKKSNVTLVFECIDPVNDPHIIKYDYSKMVLLDIVENQIEFKKAPYETVRVVAGSFGLECKKLAYTLNSWSDFCAWYREVNSDDYLYDGKEIEGFVVEDSNGVMVKVKLSYYFFWKKMRGVVESVNKYGYYKHTSSLYDKLSNEFYGWYRKTPDAADDSRHIISIREHFYKDLLKSFVETNEKF